MTANGNSMNPADIQMDAASLLDHCRRRGINLHVKNDELSYRAAKGSMTEEIMAAIRIRKNDVMEHLARLDGPRFRVTATSANRAPLFNRFLWKDYSNRLMDVSGANTPHIVKRCAGEMLTDALLKSIEILLEHHDVLNSSIEIAEGNLYLVRNTPKTVAFHEVMVAAGMDIERESEGYRIANDLVWKEYDLDNGPLYRVFIIRLSAVEYILGVALHHAIGDLISIGVMFHELLSIYSSVVNGTALLVSPPRLRYMDYLASMEAWSAGAACDEYIRYWKYKLQSTPVPDLRPEGKRSLNTALSGSTAETKLRLDASASRGLKKIAVQLKTTLFVVLLSIYKIAIRRMTRQDEPVVVALHAGRPDAGFQNAIGDFAMEVAYKTCLAGNPDLSEVVRRVTLVMNEAHLHQPVPLDWVRLALAEEGISFYAPGINFISGHASYVHNSLEPRQLSFTPPGAKHGCHGFQVSCAMELRDGSSDIDGSMMYRNDLYDESVMHAFTNCFMETVSDVVRNTE